MSRITRICAPIMPAALLVLLALSACADQQPSDPAHSLVRVDAEPPGRHCPEGGSAVHVGLDDDGNSALDDDEITSTTYVCDDELAPLLSRIDDEPAGSNCPTGGTAIQAGLDLDGDGALDDAEVLRVDYVCDQKELVRMDEEPAGPNCATGGVAVRSGNDLDGSGALDDAEVTATEYVCDGIVTGDLEIYGPDDLAALAEVTVVTGNVLVSNLLPDAGDIVFPALRMIGGDFELESSDSATSLSLPALEILGGRMRIAHDDVLASIALPALRRARSIDISANPALVIVDLGALQSLEGWLQIWESPIQDIDLGALSSLGQLDVWHLPAPLALPNLVAVDELNLIESTLTSFSAPRLELVRRDVRIGNNPSLPLLSFPALTAIGGSLSVRGNDALTSFALPALTDLGNDLTIRENAALPGFSLPALHTIGGYLSIVDNDALLSLDGLAELQTIQYGFLFEGNPSVADLSGLGQLRRVGAAGGDFLFDVQRSGLNRLGLPNLVELRVLRIGGFSGALPNLETIDLPRLRHADEIRLVNASAARRLDLPELDAVWGVLVVAFSPSMPTCRTDALVAQLAVVGAVNIGHTDDAATCD